MMAPNSHHLIQISIVEEYRIFRTINLDKNDDFFPRIAPPVSILLLLYLKKKITPRTSMIQVFLFRNKPTAK
jgi:hypothetical protein